MFLITVFLPVFRYDQYRIIEKNGGKAPLTYRQVINLFILNTTRNITFFKNIQFQNIIASVDPPPPPEADITFETIGRGYTPIDDSVDDRFSVPTLEELGIDRYN